jgi:hypothetical protein
MCACVVSLVSVALHANLVVITAAPYHLLMSADICNAWFDSCRSGTEGGIQAPLRA